jgi:hypothetical protein
MKVGMAKRIRFCCALAVLSACQERSTTDIPRIDDAPIPNPRVKQFLQLSDAEKRSAFENLALDDALDAAAFGLLRHPPDLDNWRLKAAVTKFGPEVVPALLQKLSRARPNTDIELTLDLLEQALDLLPDRRLSETHLREVETAAEKLEGPLARRISAEMILRLRHGHAEASTSK